MTGWRRQILTAKNFQKGIVVSCPKYLSKPLPWWQNPVVCCKPAVFRDRTIASHSVSSNKVCDKVHGKGRVRPDLELELDLEESGFIREVASAFAPRYA